MTRILNELEPTSILELGLGVSTTLISSYFSHESTPDGVHLVVEQDKNWADFYKRKHSVSSSCNMYVAECIKKTHRGVEYWAYKDISEVVSGKKFDIISIDGPWGGEGRYSRRDILEYIPQIIGDDFVILMDDAGRKGEKQTVEEIKQILNLHGIKHYSTVYAGNSYLAVVASENNKFLCSL